MRSAAAPPRSIRVMQRASVDGSPAARRSMKSSCIERDSPRRVGSDGDKGMAKAELFAQAAHDLAVGGACFRGLDNPFENVFALAVGCPCERVERAAHVALASLLLVGLEACHVLRHA